MGEWVEGWLDKWMDECLEIWKNGQTQKQTKELFSHTSEIMPSNYTGQCPTFQNAFNHLPVKVTRLFHARLLSPNNLIVKRIAANLCLPCPLCVCVCLRVCPRAST